MTIQELQAVSEAIANRVEEKSTVRHDRAFVKQSRYGFTVYAVTGSGYVWSHSTWSTVEGATFCAAGLQR